MSTRCSTDFVDSYGRVRVRVYRHSDGYPECAGVDIRRFLADVRAQTSDTRFDDPNYLAVKYVVWLVMRRFARKYDWNARPATISPSNPLDFLSVGIMDPNGPAEAYRYVIECDGVPTVVCYERGNEVPVPIPDLPADYVPWAGDRTDPLVRE